MVSRAKKNGLNLRLIAAYQIGVSLGDKCRDIFSILKQMWFVPFFWSLTWFSYWIIRDVLVLNASLTQVKPMNLAGAVVSMSVLLLAVPRLGTFIRNKSITLGTCLAINMKKAFVHARVRFSKRGALAHFHNAKNDTRPIQAEIDNPEKLQVEHQSSFGKNETAKPKNLTEKITKAQSITSAISSNASYSPQKRMSQEIASECLTCANLISCNHRRIEPGQTQVQNNKSSKCPLLEKLANNRNLTA
jgi:hypothetical protein